MNDLVLFGFFAGVVAITLLAANLYIALRENCCPEQDIIYVDEETEV